MNRAQVNIEEGIEQKKRKLYMIGNSHIDPVWFWKWNEGMQEVKATFSSALDRIDEYKEFIFTSSSVSFYKWIEKIAPDMFERIREKVKDGRWEIVGGWFVEPDCNLPSGESFVRQALYSQRYLKEKFGRIVRIGYNIDSFGHNSALPQLLKKSGIDYYIFMRPKGDNIPPLFKWIGKDGSIVTACRLLGEYTTWFKEATIKNIDYTLENMGNFNEMVCFYGVGNHGGGPTKENIETVIELRADYPSVSFEFSTLENFFKNVEKYKLEEYKGELERLSVGCYSVDSQIKALNRMAESAAVKAEMFGVFPYIAVGEVPQFNKSIQEIWEAINFNQFHDILAGTSIKEARDEAVMQLGGAVSKAHFIKNLSIQNLINNINTQGEGFPLIIFNTNGYQLNNEYVEVELNWFCKAPLTILDVYGNEVPYQRIKTSCTMINRNIGGRRRVIFKASVPALGYSIYRLLEKEPEIVLPKPDDKDNYILENSFIRLEFDREEGCLISVLDKRTGYDMLSDKVRHKVYTDKRDTWGGGEPELFGYYGETFKLKEIKRVETGVHRSTIRVIYTYNSSLIEQHYELYKDCDYFVVKNHLVWNEKHKLLKMSFPTNIKNPVVRAEVPYGFIDREFLNGEEDFMHSWVNVYDKNTQAGALIINDSKYGYSMQGCSCELTVVRSPIFAHGTCEGWFNDNETYMYTDQGEQDFIFILKPHGIGIKNNEAIKLSHKINIGIDYIADTNHPGLINDVQNGFIKIDKTNIMLSALKRAEDDNDIVLRLYETEGIKSKAEISMPFCKKKIEVEFNPCEIKTIKVSKDVYKEINLLEFDVDL